jgi:hypothetical protein
MKTEKRLIRRPRIGQQGRPVTVAICGPDGSGKSTIAAKLIEDLDRNLIPWRHIHVRPYRVDAAIRRRTPFPSPDARTGTNPHGLKQYRILPAVIKAVVMALDASTLWFDRLIMKKQGGVLLVERSIIDLFVDPIRYGLSSLPFNFLLRLSITSLVVDLVVLCRCSPELAFDRKGEIDIREIANQYCRWDQLQKYRPLAGLVIQIDTATPPGPISLDAIVRMWQGLRKQYGASSCEGRIDGWAPR